ncbi:TetR/AcrR family transcriptional regulator [Gammaproteobacteria bacterium AS21]
MVDKKQIITQTAFKLFAQKGIHAVGINEIIKESKVAKKTLYHHFSSKELLVISTLEYRDDIFLTWMKQAMAKQTSPTLALSALFKALDRWFNDKSVTLGAFYGCFFINVAAEFKQQNSDINQACQQHKKQVRSLINNYVNKLQIDNDNIDFITDTVCLLKEGCITTALVQHDKSAARQAEAALNKLLLTI